MNTLTYMRNMLLLIAVKSAVLYTVFNFIIADKLQIPILSYGEAFLLSFLFFALTFDFKFSYLLSQIDRVSMLLHSYTKLKVTMEDHSIKTQTDIKENLEYILENLSTNVDFNGDSVANIISKKHKVDLSDIQYEYNIGILYETMFNNLDKESAKPIIVSNLLEIPNFYSNIMNEKYAAENKNN